MMKILFGLILLLCNFVNADKLIEKFPFNSADIQEIYKEKKNATADYLFNTYFPEDSQKLLKLLSHGDYKARKLAKDLITFNRKFEPSVRSYLNQSNDPEVIENCREILEKMKAAHSKLSFRANPVIAYLASVDYKYENSSKFKKVYLKHTAVDIELDAFLKNYKPEFQYFLDLEFNSGASREVPDASRKKMASYFKKSFPEQLKVYQARVTAGSMDLGLSRLIKKIEEQTYWGEKDVKNYAEYIRSREDFKENEVYYCWKLLLRDNGKTISIGIYLIKDNPESYFPYIWNKVKEKDLSAPYTIASSLKLIKGFKELFEDKIDDLLSHKSYHFGNLSLGLIKDPSIYLEELFELAGHAYNDELNKLLLNNVDKLEIKKLKQILFNLDIEKYRIFYAFRLMAKVLSAKGFTADKDVNDYFMKLNLDTEDYQNNIISVIHELKVSPEVCFDIYFRNKGELQIRLQDFKYIFNNNKHEKLEYYLLNEHVLGYDSDISILAKYPGALREAARKYLMKIKDNDPKSFRLYFGCENAMAILHEQNELIPLLSEITANGTLLQKYCLYPILVGSGGEVNDEKFFTDLKPPYSRNIEDILKMLILAERPAMEILKVINYYSENKRFKYRDLSFAVLLTQKHQKYLPNFLEELKNTVNEKKQLFLCASVLMLDKKNKDCFSILEKLFKSKNKNISKEALRILRVAGGKPEIDKNSMHKYLRSNFYSARYVIGEEKYIEMAQDFALSKLNEIIVKCNYNLPEYLKPKNEKSSKIYLRLLQAYKEGNDKIKSRIAEALISRPERVSIEDLKMMFNGAKSEKNFEVLVKLSGIIGQEASELWPLIKKRYEGKGKYKSLYLNFAGARMPDKQALRREYFIKLMKPVAERSDMGKVFKEDIKLLGLVPEFKTEIQVLLNKVIISNNYYPYEKYEALKGLTIMGFKDDMVQYFAKNLNERALHNFIKFLHSHPDELKSQYTKVSKNYVLYQKSLHKIIDLKLKGVL